jgi:hypothetical protein
MIANEGVILLHGLCRISASLAKMASDLSIAGFVVENVNYPPPISDEKQNRHSIHLPISPNRLF